MPELIADPAHLHKIIRHLYVCTNSPLACTNMLHRDAADVVAALDAEREERKQLRERLTEEAMEQVEGEIEGMKVVVASRFFSTGTAG